MPSFPFFKQLDAMDCGPSCLRMIARHYGKTYTLQTLRDKSYLSRDGVSMMGISEAAEAIGLRTMGVSISAEKLFSSAPLPLVAHWKQNHFVVVYKISRNKVFVADPAFGLVQYTKEEFIKGWISIEKEGEQKGMALLIETTPDFYAEEGEVVNKSSFRFLLSYLKPFRKFVAQLFLGMLLGSLLQLLFPFLTQSIIDVGINNQDIPFITLILVAQLVLLVSRMSVDFIRGWILLHLSTRVNISLISDFLIKLMKLPLGFFDIKLIGDILQRVGDHRRIEYFLTSSSLNIMFSLVNLLIFGIVLAIYSWKILLLFVIGSLLYFLWLSIFMRKRRELDFKRFSNLAENQSKLIQLIHGVQDIKLYHAEKQKRWEWENIQGSLFKVNIRSLALTQYQEAGGIFLNETKNILITFLAATSVIHGDMTLGMMLAVAYILGQLNSPIEQLIHFMHVTQDAKISLERLGEIHQEVNEEEEERTAMIIVPESRGIQIRDLFFQYEGPHSKKILNNLNLEIPADKVTAIVGVSGSGKTTLVKLLLSFYPPVEGDIRVGDTSLQSISQQIWRRRCGVVMQDGYIFSDTLARNIALGEEHIDPDRLLNAVKMVTVMLL